MDRKRKDFFQTFETPEGKRVLVNLNQYTKALIANKPINNDSHTMAYRAGQQSVMIHIYAMLNRQINEPKQERAVNE